MCNVPLTLPVSACVRVIHTSHYALLSLIVFLGHGTLNSSDHVSNVMLTASVSYLGTNLVFCAATSALRSALISASFLAVGADGVGCSPMVDDDPGVLFSAVTLSLCLFFLCFSGALSLCLCLDLFFSECIFFFSLPFLSLLFFLRLGGGEGPEEREEEEREALLSL